jgi:hypothetical protein
MDSSPKKENSVMYVVKMQQQKWEFGEEFYIVKLTCSSYLHIVVYTSKLQVCKRCLDFMLLTYNFVMQLSYFVAFPSK